MSETKSEYKLGREACLADKYFDNKKSGEGAVASSKQWVKKPISIRIPPRRREGQ